MWACNRPDLPAGPSIAPALQCGPYAAQASSPYVLPYAVGEAFLVVQANCSDGPTHVPGASFKHAYDFLMPIGTPIHAARDGVVVGVEVRHADFNSPSRPANFVFVRHEDGTMARYFHLTQRGALVVVGQSVRAGDRIALSGATGLSDTPHLHFEVTPCPELGCVSLPVTFRNTRPHPYGLVAGESYRAQ